MGIVKYKTAAVISAAVFIFIVSGCATAGGRKIKTNTFLDTVGAVAVFTGMAAGAYAGTQISGGNDGDLSLGVAGGLIGAAAAGGIFWLILNMAAVPPDDRVDPIKEPPDDKTLLPQE